MSSGAPVDERMAPSTRRSRAIFDALEARDGVGTLWLVASETLEPLARQRGWLVQVGEPMRPQRTERSTVDAVLYRAGEADYDRLCRDLTDVHAWLRPGGSLYLQVPNRSAWLGRGSTDLDRRYEVEVLRSTLEARGYQVVFARCTPSAAASDARGRLRRWLDRCVDVPIRMLSLLGVAHVGPHLELLARKPVWATERANGVVLEPRVAESRPRHEIAVKVVEAARTSP